MGVSGGGGRQGGVGIGSKEHTRELKVWCVLLWKEAVRECVCVTVVEREIQIKCRSQGTHIYSRN